MATNREYKNGVLALLFSDPALIRELYGAIAEVEIPPDTPVIINTLENALASDLINDFSCMIGDSLVLFAEHQSTINPNMAFRMFLYAAEVYKKIIADNEYDMYGPKPLSLPRPEFIVLYNGRKTIDEKVPINLAPLFRNAAALGITGLPPMDLSVMVYNINAGKNAAIMARCETLRQYSVFIAKAREYGAENVGRGPLADGRRRKAIAEAVAWCRAHDILKSFLTKHGTEVISVLARKIEMEELAAIYERQYREMAMEDAAEMAQGMAAEMAAESIERAREENRAETVRNLFDFGMMPDQISQALKLPLETVLRYGDRQQDAGAFQKPSGQ